MANSYKNIVITPNTGSATGDPTVVFSGGNTTVNTDVTLRVYPESNGTISFEGSAGQLFSITNDLSNSIFSVNDVSGIPLIEVNVSSQQITLGEFYGNVGVGKSSSTSSIYKLDVNGTINASNVLINGSPITGVANLTPANGYVNTSTTAANNYAGAMANASNAYASTIVDANLVTARAYTNTSTTAANNYAGAMANAANAYASTIVDANLVTARAYTNTSTTAANNYAGAMANAANAYATTINDANLVVARAYTNTSVTAANNYASTIVDANLVTARAYTNTSTTAANNYAGVMANSVNAYANTLGTNTSFAYSWTNNHTFSANVFYRNTSNLVWITNAVSTTSNVTLRNYPDSNGTLSFEGSAGQLFSITNDLTGSIFAVNDVSGIPLIEVNVASQQITLGQFYGNVGIGTNAANSSIYKLDVNGTINASNILINGNAITVSLTPANNYAGVMANSANGYANATFGTITNTTAAFAAANQAGVVANNANTYAGTTFVKKSGDTITGDLVVQGNLTTSGVVTYANTQTLLIGDSLITLNNDIPIGVAPSEDSGIEVKRGSSANVALLWNEGSDRWTFTNDGTNYRLIASNTDVESANNYAGAMANAANAIAATIVSANLDTARAYTNTSTTAANNYAGVMANSANAYAASLTPDLSPAFNKANSAYLVANAAFDKANTGGGGGGASTVNVSTTGPTNNTSGTLWFNSNLGRLFVYYTDVDSSQWIEASPSSGSVDVGLLQAYTNAAADLAVLSYNQSNTAFNTINVVFGVTNAAFGIANVGNAAFGVTNSAFGVANAAFGVANAAFNAANNRLANSTVTLAGTLTTTGAVVDSKGDTRDIPPTDRTASMPYALTISDTGKMVLANGNTAATANIFVPNAIFAIGNTIMILNQSTSNVTITQNSSVTMFLAGNAAASGNRTLAGKGIATLICVGANNFIISGAGLT
jgi:hypothetical protein